MLMKKNIALITLIFLIILGTNTVFADIFYYDTFGHWAEDTIYWATNEVKIFNGYEDGTFKPNDNISRSEYIKALYCTAKAQGIIEKIDTSNNEVINIDEELVDDENDIQNKQDESNLFGYTDLQRDFWAYNYIKLIGEYINSTNKEIKFNDIFPGNKFEPQKDITREEAVLLASFFTSPTIENINKKFKDISDKYKYKVQIDNLANNKIITGYPDDTFRPYDNITRAESATIVERIYKDMEFLKGKYLNDIQLINDTINPKFTLFGNYETEELSEYDDKYKLAITTLEYKSIGGYIFPGEEHMYDSNPVETLKELKDSGYENIIGVNYYLIKFAEMTNEEKEELYEEIIESYLDRTDLTDYESILIFKEGFNYNIDQEKIFEGLNKWEEITQDDISKANIKFLKYKYYIVNDKLDELVEIIQSEEIQNEDKVMEENNISETENQLESDIDNPTEDRDETDKEGEKENEGIEEIVEIEPKLENLEIIKANIMNKAYVYLSINNFVEAEKILRQGWDQIKENDLYESSKEKYDKEFIGGIKQVLINKRNYESIDGENNEVEE